MRGETSLLSTPWPKQPCLFTIEFPQVIVPDRRFLANFLFSSLNGLKSLNWGICFHFLSVYFPVFELAGSNFYQRNARISKITYIWFNRGRIRSMS